jgi:hypothetical protein
MHWRKEEKKWRQGGWYLGRGPLVPDGKYKEDSIFWRGCEARQDKYIATPIE